MLDVASGVGQDSVELSGRGARVVGAEPSARMTAMAEAFGAEHLGPDARGPAWVRGWADALPFAADRFDASFCKLGQLLAMIIRLTLLISGPTSSSRSCERRDVTRASASSTFRKGREAVPASSRLPRCSLRSPV